MNPISARNVTGARSMTGAKTATTLVGARSSTTMTGGKIRIHPARRVVDHQAARQPVTITSQEKGNEHLA
jgi:hypothetical protein